jgi:hypothetical protein
VIAPADGLSGSRAPWSTIPAERSVHHRGLLCPDGAASFELARQCCKAARTSAFSPFFGCPHPAFYQFGLPYWSNRVLTHARMRAALPSFEERRDYITERLAV